MGIVAFIIATAIISESITGAVWLIAAARRFLVWFRPKMFVECVLAAGSLFGIAAFALALLAGGTPIQALSLGMSVAGLTYSACSIWEWRFLKNGKC